MANENHHIDELFKEQIKGYREKPPVYAWDKLKEDVYWMRRRKKATAIRWSGAAAAIVIAFITGYYFAIYNLDQDMTVQNQPEEQSVPASNVPETVFSEDIQQGDPSSKLSLVQTEVQEPRPQDQLLALAVQDVVETETTSEISGQNDHVADLMDQTQDLADNIDQPTIGIETEPNNGAISNPEPGLTDIPAGDELTELNEQVFETESIAIKPANENESLTKYNDYTLPLDDLIPKEDIPESKWTLGGVFAPVYAYRNIEIMGEDLPPNVINDEGYYNDVENGVYSFSGGLDIAYNFEKNWSFQSGLLYSKIGQQIDDIIALEDLDSKDNYLISTSIGPIDITEEGIPYETNNASIREDSTGNLVFISSNIYQNFEYIEIPLVIKYKVLDNRFSMNLSGGLSPGLMVNNTAYMQIEELDYQLDRSEEFYPVIYNTVIGVGLDYAIKSNLHLSFTPAFKYSLNSIRKDHSIQYHPYSISLFTGISYTF